jgi:hypothetical protein
MTTFLDVLTWLALAAGALAVGVFLFARRR